MKPSPTAPPIKNRIPKNYAFMLLSLFSGSKKKNRNIDMVTKIPPMILSFSSFSLRSLTLVQHTPTKITDKRLEDLNINMMG